MEQITNSTKTTTCLVFSLISFYLIASSVSRPAYSSGYYAAALVLVLAFLIVLAVRTTLVAWITVLVLLAFAGKRRRVLAKEGRKITSDVAMYLAQVVIKEKSFVAFTCATVMSLMGMALLG
ncbi:uncharacterized protein LOC125190897 [Salvia hispanica]|uniref:uncharacterized protein LOC125190897 n=1 Tax=Salvia hispanica TaxID=49212 RepID=UPI0020092A77|nr:uncharacterized protein LOC125190897 [Salvia hispanica]